ncbi:MAG: hypothetical protein ACM3N4_07370, partial [Nitrososphaerota archaeon]
MFVLHIEHPVPDFAGWKRAFDSDPVGRKQSGVIRYQITRPIDDPNYAIIDLEFATAREAEGLLAAMRQVWGRVQGSLIGAPQTRISEVIDTQQL